MFCAYPNKRTPTWDDRQKGKNIIDGIDSDTALVYQRRRHHRVWGNPPVFPREFTCKLKNSHSSRFDEKIFFVKNNNNFLVSFQTFAMCLNISIGALGAPQHSLSRQNLDIKLKIDSTNLNAFNFHLKGSRAVL